MPDLPRVGSSALAQVTNCRPFSFAFLVIDPQLLTPPMAVSGLPSGCLAYLDPFNALKVILWGTDAAGVFGFPLAIPPSPGLAGVSFAMQGVVPLFAPIAPLPFTVSNAGIMTVGF